MKNSFIPMAWASALMLATAAMAAAQDKAEPKSYPLWDGKESQAEYAKRAGIPDVNLTLDLGNQMSMKLTLIPAGKFTMGCQSLDKALASSASALPVHEVTLSKPFYLGTYEVTQEQFRALMGINPSLRFGPNLPVTDVSWIDAMRFCDKLAKQTGKKVSLPTEAQWEYAYRAGTTTAFFFGDDPRQLGDYAWTTENSQGYDAVQPVGLKKPSPWGLYDIAGNAPEWVLDWFSDVYHTNQKVDPQGPRAGGEGRYERVWRGGHTGVAWQWCTAYHRKHAPPRGYAAGLRVAVPVE